MKHKIQKKSWCYGTIENKKTLNLQKSWCYGTISAILPSVIVSENKVSQLRSMRLLCLHPQTSSIYMFLLSLKNLLLVTKNFATEMFPVMSLSVSGTRGEMHTIKLANGIA